MFFFFKQKTAYEMRISDWSSDVCSFDLVPRELDVDLVGVVERAERPPRRVVAGDLVAEAQALERKTLIDGEGLARPLVLSAQGDQLLVRIVPGDRGHEIGRAHV